MTSTLDTTSARWARAQGNGKSFCGKASGCSSSMGVKSGKQNKTLQSAFQEIVACPTRAQ